MIIQINLSFFSICL